MTVVRKRPDLNARWMRSRAQAVAEQQVRRKQTGGAADWELAALRFNAGPNPKTCQFIAADPRRDPTKCDDPTRPGSPYCDAHHRRCYLPKGTLARDHAAALPS